MHIQVVFVSFEPQLCGACTPLFEDSAEEHSPPQTPRSSSRRRYIDVDDTGSGQDWNVLVRNVDSKDQHADSLPKTLGLQSFRAHRKFRRI